MISLDRGLRHLRWADDAFFAALAERPIAALDARVSPATWPVGQLAMHIVQGAQWYRYCLTGQSWTDLPVARGAADLMVLRSELRSANTTLIESAENPDTVVTFEDEHGPSSALRSTILTQACVHSAEHRAQISAALEVAGFEPVVLDDLDLWAFERHDMVAIDDSASSLMAPSDET